MLLKVKLNKASVFASGSSSYVGLRWYFIFYFFFQRWRGVKDGRHNVERGMVGTRRRPTQCEENDAVRTINARLRCMQNYSRKGRRKQHKPYGSFFIVYLIIHEEFLLNRVKIVGIWTQKSNT